MKRFILNLLVFIVFVVLLDALCGFLCTWLIDSANAGDTVRERSVYDGTIKEKILIFGSSRANHHYVPAIIEKELGKSCYNCGVDGTGIVNMYGRLSLILEHHTPELIVYDVAHAFDLLKNDNTKYLGKMRYFYHNETVKEIFALVDERERYKMLSNMYRFNSKAFQLIADNLTPIQSENDGYRPMFGKIDYDVNDANKAANKHSANDFDSVKIELLKRFILKCRNKCKLVFAISPYYLNDQKIYTPIEDLCEKYDIPLLAFNNDTAFIGKKELFADSVHLNDDGAKVFSEMISKIIKELLY